MKNKIAAVSLAALLALGTVACSGGGETEGGEGTTTGASELTS